MKGNNFFNTNLFLHLFMILFISVMNKSYAFERKYDVTIKENASNSVMFDPNLSVISVSSDCNNNFVLTTSLITPNGEQIYYYYDSALTQRVQAGTFAGVTYTLSNPTSSSTTLSITNLQEIQTIYAARVNGSNTVVTLVGEAPSEVIVPRNIYSNSISSNIQGCGSVDLVGTIQNPNLIASIFSIDYYYDNSNSPSLPSPIVSQPGNYVVKITTNSGCSFEKNVDVNILTNANLTVSNTQILLFIGQTFTINATSSNNSTISYFDVTNNKPLPGPAISPYSTAGNYIIRVDATNGSCVTSEFVNVTVDSQSICKVINQRIYANKATESSWLNGGIITAPANAANSNTETFATLTVPVGLLGLTRAYIDLEFANPVPAGKPIIIKLGTEYGGLDLISGATVTALTKNGNNNITTVGTPLSVNANLLGLLNGSNEFEYTFNPSVSSGTQIYGVRVLISSLLSIAQSLNVYNAYYISDSVNTGCQNDIYDVLSGTKGYGVTILNNTVGVDNPRDFNDNSDSAFTRMYVGVGVLAESYLTPVYSNYSNKDDIIELIISKPNGVLDLTLLGALTYRKFDRDVPVSELTSAEINILDLTLLSGTTDKYILRLQDTTTRASWDRFELRLGAVAGVLNFLNIYSIKRIPKVEFTTIPTQPKYTFCKGQELTVLPQDCTTYKWYSTPTGTNSLISSTGTFEIPQSLAAGDYTYYVQAIRNNCEVLNREAISFTVGTSLPVSALSATNTFNSPSNCAGNVTLTANIDPTYVLTDAYYQWYKMEAGNSVIIPGESSSTLVLTGLQAGNYTYYVGVGSSEYCVTPASQRVRVDFLVPRLNTANDFSTNTSINDCNDLSLTITPNTNLTNVVYKWYFDSQGVNEITSGTFSGITYTILANKLVITNLANTQQNLTYYATLSSDQTCLNTKDLQKIDVLYTPVPLLSTLVPGDQNFCINGNATLGDVRLNYSDIDWYDSQTGGNILPVNTVVQNNVTYYAVRRATITCTNYTRLPVKVMLDIIPPPLVPTTQTFCAILNAQIDDLLTNNYNVVWKDINGVVLADTEYLKDGQTYYAYNFVSQNCESQTPTAVTVTINDNCNIDPDIEVTITANNTEPNYLSDVIFTVTLKNLSPVNFMDVVTEVVLNSGFQYNSHTTTGIYDRTDWVIPSLKANTTEVLTITAKVLNFGSYEQRAKLLRSNPVDTNPTNNEDTVLINPVGTADECLVAYNEISPNGDGYNDFFVISCINNYRQTKLEIYNRYGNLVYKNSDYDNSFNGHANVSGTFSGNELPSGTYFYTLQFIDGVTPNKSGWLYIMR